MPEQWPEAESARHRFGAGRANVPVLPPDGSSSPAIERATMYNATEQFAELNKASVVERDQARVAVDRKRRKARPTEHQRRQARDRASRRRRASRRFGQGRAGAARAAREARRSRRAKRDGLLAYAVRTVVGSASRILGARRRIMVARTPRASPPGSKRRANRAGRLGCRRQRAQVDVRRLDGRVRPVPEGDEAGRRAWPTRAFAPRPPSATKGATNSRTKRAA